MEKNIFENLRLKLMMISFTVINRYNKPEVIAFRVLWGLTWVSIGGFPLHLV